MTTLRDNLWLWGQTPGSHHNPSHYHLPGVNRMTPAEGCAFFGISNCCRVAMSAGPFPPFDEESRQLTHLKKVIWSILGAGGIASHNQGGLGDLEEVIRQAKKFPNIVGGILDDFFSETRRKVYPPENIAEVRRRLIEGSGRNMELWVVWYEREIQVDISQYLPSFDAVTFWTWYGENLAELPVNLDRMISATPDKRRYAGCYLWDYGNAKPLSDEMMLYQLETSLQYIRSGKLNGIILCSNCCADLGLSTVEVTQKWLKTHANEKIPLQ